MEKQKYDNQLVMLWPVKPVPSWQLPDGYTLRTYRHGDSDAYISLMHKAGFNDFNEESVKTIMQTALPNGLFFIVHEQSGALVATTVATHNPAPLHPFGGELGWVAGDPAHKGKGFGYITCTAVMKRYLEAGYEHVYLKTDDWRSPAIKIYIKLGWVPFLYLPDMLERWRIVYSELKIPAVEADWIKA